MTIDSKNLVFGDFLSMVGTVRIPRYQRHYQWTQGNWSTLYDDVTSNKFVPPSVEKFSYFIGSLILIDDPYTAKKCTVVDGQQRITTICLWVLALRHRAHETYLRASAAAEKLKKLRTRAESVISTPLDQLGSIEDVEKRNKKLKQWAEKQKTATAVDHVLPAFEKVIAECEGIIKDTDELLRTLDHKNRLILAKQNGDNVAYEELLAAVLVEKTLPLPEVAAKHHLVERAYHYFWREYSDVRMKVPEGNGQLGPKVSVAKKQRPQRLTLLSQVMRRHLDSIRRLRAAAIIATDEPSAYMLFEGLNYRAEPLSVLDLLKNHLLSQVDADSAKMDDAYERWTKMVELVEAKYQPHFLRHVYLAFPTWFPVDQTKKLPESLVLKKYRDNTSDLERAYGMVKLLGKKAEIYVRFSNPMSLAESQTAAARELDVLDTASARPTGVLLLRLLQEGNLGKTSLLRIIIDLQKFFIRRHLTQRPATQDLEPIFVDLALDYTNQELDDYHQNVLLPALRKHSAPVSDALRKAVLCGADASLSRAILALLEYANRTQEDKPPLYERKNDKIVYTLEHVLPQTLSDDWKDTLIGGGVPEASVEAVHTKYLQCLGNLTLTQFNQSLSNQPFVEKRDKVDETGRKIGYNNGLWLNKDLEALLSWTPEACTERAVVLVSSLRTALSFKDEELPAEESISLLVQNALDEGDSDDAEEEEEDVEEPPEPEDDEDGAESADSPA